MPSFPLTNRILYSVQNIGVRASLKDLRKITDTGRKVTTGYGICSSTSSGVTVYEFVTTDGQRLEGMVSSVPVFDIDRGARGVPKNIWLNHVKSIEVAASGPAPAASRRSPARTAASRERFRSLPRIERDLMSNRTDRNRTSRKDALSGSSCFSCSREEQGKKDFTCKSAISVRRN